jgi:hypothetical protein
MKRYLTMLSSALVLCLGGLVMFLNARPDDAPARTGDKLAESPSRIVKSKITHVTVYPNSALVTREVEVPAGAGAMEVVVSPLPEHTVNSSLYSEGSDGIRVLTTRFRMRPIKEDTREEVRKLEDELKKLRHEAQRIQADIQTCTHQMELLNKLETFTQASTQNATEKGKLDSEATITLAKYLMEGRADKSKNTIALQQQLELNHEQTEFANRKLREMTAGTSRTERDAVIVVDKADAAPGKVRLNYLVDAASWHPQYKLRAGNGAKDNVQVEYLAAIMQQTGEEWQGVDMVLSTAQPMLNAAPPELMMLAVNVVPRDAQVANNEPMAQQVLGNLANRMDRGGGKPTLGTIANPGANSYKDLSESAKKVREAAQTEANLKKDAKDIFNYAGALEQARDLVVAAEERTSPAKGKPHAGSNEGPSVTYHLSNRLTVPSRNEEQVIEVARIDMNPEYYYKAVPVLTPHIYRQANLVNKSKYVLLPGEATMYNGSDFVGRMNLPLVAIGEQLTVGFGTEPQLQVHRQLMDKSRTMQGGNQILRYEYRILVNSYKPERIKLQLWDRLPHAENETMGVTLLKQSPELSRDPLYQREERPSNLLRWDLEVDPDMNGEKAKEVTYEFRLELDRQMSIGSFQSK